MKDLTVDVMPKFTDPAPVLTPEQQAAVKKLNALVVAKFGGGRHEEDTKPNDQAS